MWAVIGGIIQLVFLILKNKYEQDDVERKRKEEIHAEWKDVVKSGDASRITGMLDKLRS